MDRRSICGSRVEGALGRRPAVGRMSYLLLVACVARRLSTVGKRNENRRQAAKRKIFGAAAHTAPRLLNSMAATMSLSARAVAPAALRASARRAASARASVVTRASSGKGAPPARAPPHARARRAEARQRARAPRCAQTT